jgi:hypothetical protein
MKNKLLRKLESAVIRRGWKMIRPRVFRKQVKSALRKPLPPVLVYQMAKVASRGVADALAKRPDVSVLHFHFCDPENSAYMYRQLFGEEGLKRGTTDSAVFGRMIYDHLVKPRHKAFVITLVREPIARNISSYFHNLNIIWRQRNAHAIVPFENLVEGFLTKHMSELPLEWFDREFKATLGIDVYEHPFPREQGFLRISSEPYEVLIMRHDLDDRQKERCVRELLGVEDVTIQPANRAEEQPYAEVYKHFVKNVQLPESYVSEMLDSKFTRHFYTGEEIERLRDKWLRRNQGD